MQKKRVEYFRPIGLEDISFKTLKKPVEIERYLEPKNDKAMEHLNRTANLYQIMKQLLTLSLLHLTISISAQTIQNSNYSNIYYVTTDGTVQNSNHSDIGYIKSDGTVQNSNHSNIGYIKSDGTVQNGNYSNIGYLNSDGTVHNSNHSSIGYVKDDGTVQDSNHSNIGYAKGVKKEWAAVLFFFKFY